LLAAQIGKGAMRRWIGVDMQRSSGACPTTVHAIARIRITAAGRTLP
jgi:hypothetical protein